MGTDGASIPVGRPGRVDRKSAFIARGSMDALSDVLKSVRLEGAVYLNAEFTAPWCVSAKFGIATARARLAGAERVLYFHYIVEGGCKVRLADGHEHAAVAQDL